MAIREYYVSVNNEEERKKFVDVISRRWVPRILREGMTLHDVNDSGFIIDASSGNKIIVNLICSPARIKECKDLLNHILDIY